MQNFVIRRKTLMQNSKLSYEMLIFLRDEELLVEIRRSADDISYKFTAYILYYKVLIIALNLLQENFLHQMKNFVTRRKISMQNA